MGSPKPLLALDGKTLLERALAATRDFPTILVVAPNLRAYIAPRPNLQIVINDAAERGMSHSLRLADARLADRGASLAVLLVDTPLVDAALLRRVLEARGEADVAYPVRAGVAGHPVVFGPRPRSAIAQLPDGDTLRGLRDDPRWRRVGVPESGPAPYVDVDTPADLARLAVALAETTPVETPSPESKL